MASDELFSAGQYEQALAQYQQESNLRMIGCTLEAMGHIEAAEDFYVQAVKKANWDARMHLALAEYYLRSERWEQAEQSAQAGLKASNSQAADLGYPLSVALASAQMKLGRLPEAVRSLERLEKLQFHGFSPDLAIRKLKLLALQGRGAEAQALAVKARNELKDALAYQANSTNFSLLGDCFWLQGDFDAAEEAYKKALRVEPVDSAAHRGMGVLAEKKRDLQAAREYYEMFLRLDPLNLAAPHIRQRLQALAQA